MAIRRGVRNANTFRFRNMKEEYYLECLVVDVRLLDEEDLKIRSKLLWLRRETSGFLFWINIILGIFTEINYCLNHNFK